MLKCRLDPFGTTRYINAKYANEQTYLYYEQIKKFIVWKSEILKI